MRRSFYFAVFPLLALGSPLPQVSCRDPVGPVPPGTLGNTVNPVYPVPSGNPGNPGSPGNPVTSVATQGRATVINNCPYDIHLRTAGNSQESGTTKIAKSGGKWSEAIRILPSGGVSIKLGKEPNNNVIAQFEYTASSTDVWYNMSYVDCMLNGGQAACPGLEKGFNLVSGEGCKSFVCPAGTICKDNAYFTPENDYQPNAPVSRCGPSEGVTLTLCSEAV